MKDNRDTAKNRYLRGQFRKGNNLRDLGGYVTEDGRVIRDGLFYRGGAPGTFLDPELEHLEQLGIRLCLDLRSREEASHLPDPEVPGMTNLQISAFSGDDGSEDFSPKAIARMVAQSKQKKKGPGSLMEFLYRRFPFDNPAYRRFFQALRDSETPVLFHCMAGKDRTGTLAAILLLFLGCSEQTALADYELTNLYRKELIEEEMNAHPLRARTSAAYRRRVTAMEGVLRENEVAALDEIHCRYPDLDAYFLKEYGIDKEERRALQERFLISQEEYDALAAGIH